MPGSRNTSMVYFLYQPLNHFCYHLLTSHSVLTKALGNACFELDPDKRPTFKECVEQMTAMLSAVLSSSPAQDGAEGLETRNQTRPALSGSEIPVALMCTNQAPVQTEAQLADEPVATGTRMVPNSTSGEPNGMAPNGMAPNGMASSGMMPNSTDGAPNGIAVAA